MNKFSTGYRSQDTDQQQKINLSFYIVAARNQKRKFKKIFIQNIIKIQCLEIHLTRVEDLYVENIKTLPGVIKDLNK